MRVVLLVFDCVEWSLPDAERVDVCVALDAICDDVVRDAVRVKEEDELALCVEELVRVRDEVALLELVLLELA